MSMEFRIDYPRNDFQSSLSVYLMTGNCLGYAFEENIPKLVNIAVTIITA